MRKTGWTMMRQQQLEYCGTAYPRLHELSASACDMLGCVFWHELLTSCLSLRLSVQKA